MLENQKEIEIQLRLVRRSEVKVIFAPKHHAINVWHEQLTSHSSCLYIQGMNLDGPPLCFWEIGEVIYVTASTWNQIQAVVMAYHFMDSFFGSQSL